MAYRPKPSIFLVLVHGFGSWFGYEIGQEPNLHDLVNEGENQTSIFMVLD